MFHFGNKHKKPTYGALFDIGSGTVGVAIAKFDIKKPIPHIIFSQRFQMRITKHDAKKEILLRKMRESIFSAALILSQDGMQALIRYDKHGKLANMFITCSSPWSYNISRTVKYSNDEPFKVSESIIEDLIHSAEETIFSNLKKKDETVAKDYSVVEKASIDISINGYSVIDPINLKGSSVSLTHVIGLIPNELTVSMQEVREKLFPNAEMRTHTYMLIIYCTIRDIFPRLSTFSIINVTGEITELGIVDNGILIENSFLNYGSSTLIREAAKITKRPIPDVVTMLSDYCDTTVDSNLLSPLVDNYIDKYAADINEIMKHKVVPDDLVLTTHRTFEPLFKYILNAAVKKATGKKRTLLTLDPKLVEDISTGTTDDVYLVLEARFFHKLHSCSKIENK